MTYIIRKLFHSKRAEKYGGKVWRVIHITDSILKTNEELIVYLKQLGGYGRYSILYPQKKHRGFKSIFRVDILRHKTKVISSDLTPILTKIPIQKDTYTNALQKLLFR